MNSFNNRIEAGQALAEELAKKNYPDPVVLALPRGGVPIRSACERFWDTR